MADGMQRTGANLKFIPMNENGDLDLTNLETTFTDSTKIISITHVSNVLGTINPINEIAKIANEIGANLSLMEHRAYRINQLMLKNWDVIFMFLGS